jgi:hypothetical protein
VRSCNHCCSGKEICIIYSESASVALGTQHAMCHAPCYIFLCGLCCSTIFFHIISITARFSWKLLNARSAFWFSLQLLSETFLNIRRTERDIVINVYWSSGKLLVILIRFNTTCIFSTEYRKIFKYKISSKHRHNAGNSGFSQFRECS